MIMRWRTIEQITSSDVDKQNDKLTNNKHVKFCSYSVECNLDESSDMYLTPTTTAIVGFLV